jgi:hypothetical membrane protein
MAWRSAALQGLAPLAGILGAVIFSLGTVVTAIAYRGADGEAYSPLNHFVSELGELANSELAVLFNLALIASGGCFAVFMLGLATVLSRRLRIPVGICGVAAGIGGSFVGLYPMDDLPPHRVAAMTFFNLGWIAVGLASFDFARRSDRRFPRGLAILGAATVVLFLAFLRELAFSTSPDGRLAAPAVRPGAWALTSLEWVTMMGIVVWVFLVGVAWKRAG